MSLGGSTAYVNAIARVTHASSRVNTFVKASHEFYNDRTNVDKRAEIEQMLLDLNDIRRQVRNDIQLMESAVRDNTAPEDVLDNECCNYLMNSFDTMYYQLVTFAEDHRFSLTPILDSSSSAANAITQSSPQNYLPAYQPEFPTFSGNAAEWQEFEDYFKSALSLAPEILDVKRFEYLKTSLDGEALALVSHLSLTAGNYHNAWEILRARYGNKRSLVRTHIDALLATQTVKYDDAVSIETLINTILKHTAALDNLGLVTSEWSDLLLHIFQTRLDNELWTRWETTVGDRPRITEFIEFLRRRLRFAEVNSNSSRMYNSFTKSSQKLNCPLCKKKHSIRKCRMFTDKSPEDRNDIAKAQRLCSNCLGQGHLLKACPSKLKCKKCNRSHNTLLHFDQAESVSNKSKIPYAHLLFRTPLQTAIQVFIVFILTCILLMNILRNHENQKILDTKQTLYLINLRHF